MATDKEREFINAAENGNLARLQELWGTDNPHQINLEALDRQGWGALTSALVGTQAECAVFLLDIGADPDKREGRDGTRSPLTVYARNMDDTPTLQLLLKKLQEKYQDQPLQLLQAYTLDNNDALSTVRLNSNSVPLRMLTAAIAGVLPAAYNQALREAPESQERVTAMHNVNGTLNILQRIAPEQVAAVRQSVPAPAAKEVGIVGGGVSGYAAAAEIMAAW